MGTPVCTYMPERTYLVDAGGTNHLVRGNMPLADDGSIAWPEMREKLLELGVDLTGRSLLIISLIDNNGELNDLELEFTGYGEPNVVGSLAWPPFFNGVDVTTQYGTCINGDPEKKGSIIWYPVQGCTDDSNCALVEDPQFAFSAEVAFLKRLLVDSENTVIYFHCEHGHDRTSALTAAYQMSFLNRSLETVLDEPPTQGAKAFGHAWEATYEALVKWYATLLP